MRNFLSVLLFAALSFFGACQETTGQGSTAAVKTITVPDFEQKLNGTQAAQLVDVRTPGEFAGGHLKNAVNMDVNGDKVSQQFATLDKARTVFVYCKAGGRSAHAAGMLADMGFKEVYNLDGGIMKWESAGKPLDNAATAQTGMSVSDLEKMVAGPHYVLVDFNAKWCAPCKQMLPVLEALAQKNKFILQKVDADENAGLLKQKGIDAIPYLELYHDGKLIWKHNGFINEQQLLEETKL